MKRFIGLVVVIILAVFISTVDGICEEYVGKEFPSEIVLSLLNIGGGPNGRIVGKTEENGVYTVFYSPRQEGGDRGVVSYRVIHLDTDKWIFFLSGNVFVIGDLKKK